MLTARERRLLKFGPYTADLDNQQLTKLGVRIPLQIKPFQILELFLQRPNELITREELQRRVWPSGTFVDFDQGLNKAINKLRAALCDTAEESRFIETVPRLGYRFIAEVTDGAQLAPSAGGISTSPAAASKWRSRSLLENWGVLQTAPSSKVASRRTRATGKVSVAVAGALLLGVSFYLAFAATPVKLWRLYQLQQLTVTPLTALSGRVASPTFSPDGSQVAFAWSEENNEGLYDLYIKTLGSERPLKITERPARWLWAAWAPDGRYIALSRVAGIDSGVYLVSPTGGPERQLSSKTTFNRNTSGISWAPNGKLLAFTDQPANASWEGDLQLFTLSLETLERTQINTGCPLVLAPAFSPKGDLLAWACVNSWSRYSIHVMRLSDGHITRLLDHADGIGGLAWSRDGSRVIFTSPLDFGDIWEVRLRHPNDPARLPVGHDASEITIAPAGKHLAYVAGTYNVNIWQLDLRNGNPARLIVSSREQKAPHESPDRRRIAFESTRSGSNELWICDADGANAKQLTSFGIRATGSPRWSPDGNTIAFDSRVDGEANIYLIDPNHGMPQKVLISNIHGNNQPAWSDDGKWIYFVHGEDAHTPSIWKVSSSGGEPVEIVHTPATYPRESPDGRHLYFVRNSRLWRSNPDGTVPEEVQGIPPLKLLGDKWVLFGEGVYYFSDDHGKAALDYFDLSSRAIRRVAVLDMPLPLWMGQMSISSDGKWLLFPQIDAQSTNLMMIENWQ